MIVRELAPEVTVGFRSGEPGDHALIYATWLRGHRFGGDWPHRVPRGRYFQQHKYVIQELLERSQVLVACNPSRESQVLGYIVSEPGVLHWVYVKPTYRWDPASDAHPRLGTALRNEAFPHLHAWVSCSHWTKAAERLSDKWGLRYRPFLLEET